MIYIIWGHPGQGKSFFGTAMAVRGLEAGKKVFTNYPVFTGKKSSLIWRPEFAGLPNPPTRCTIIIDEAYRNYNSRKFAGFTIAEHTYFATNRHNELDIYLIAQNPARIDVTIREISQFILMKKVQIPILKFIIGFKAEFYEMLEDLSARKAGQKSHYAIEWIWWSKKIARAYDTHFYGIKDVSDFEGEPWVQPEEKQETVIKLKLPELKQKVHDYFYFWKITKELKNFEKFLIKNQDVLENQVPEIRKTKKRKGRNYAKMPFWAGFRVFCREEIFKSLTNYIEKHQRKQKFKPLFGK